MCRSIYSYEETIFVSTLDREPLANSETQWAVLWKFSVNNLKMVLNARVEVYLSCHLHNRSIDRWVLGCSES